MLTVHSVRELMMKCRDKFWVGDISQEFVDGLNTLCHAKGPAPDSSESRIAVIALRDAVLMLDDLRLDYRRRFAIEEQIWLAPRVKRLDEIRKLARLL